MPAAIRAAGWSLLQCIGGRDERRGKDEDAIVSQQTFRRRVFQRPRLACRTLDGACAVTYSGLVEPLRVLIHAQNERLPATLTPPNDLSRQTAGIWGKLFQRHPTGRSKNIEEDHMTPRRSTSRRVGTLALIGSALCILFAVAPVSAQDECAGDCDSSGEVGINELITCVNISLGNADLSTCTACDVNGNDVVAINELILAVNASLCGCAGCPTPSATTPPTGPTPTATGSPSNCPLAPGRYVITNGSGGMLRVSTFSPFPFPTGGTVTMDVLPGDGECHHNVVVPAEIGFNSPAFCIPALGLTTLVTQRGCGVGQIASQGGADYTVVEHGDTSYAQGSCDVAQATCGTGGEDTGLFVSVTVGDGTADTCSAGTGQAVLAIPVHTLTWLENVPTGQPGECPAADGRYDADTSMGDTTPDMLVVEFDQNLDFTTDSTTTTWQDLDSNGCTISGQGPVAGFGTGPNNGPPCAGPQSIPCTGV